MKKTIYIALTALAVVLMSACTSPIDERQVFLSEDEVAQLIADDGGTLYNLNDFLDKYMTEEGNYWSDTSLYRTRANNGDGTWLFSVDTLPTNGPGIYIRGRITTDDYGGNFYKSLCIQQIVGGEQQALRISVDASSVSGMYPLGQEILIRVNGLAVGRYADQPQLCVPSYNNNYTANKAAEKVGWAPGRIPFARFQQATKRIGVPDVSKLQIDVVKITDFTSITDEATMRKWDGRLVRIEGVYFTGEYVMANGSLSECSKGDPEDDTNANFFAPTTGNMGYPQGRVISDGTNRTLVSTSEYAKYAYFYLPGADATGVADCPNWKGNITGILGQYRDNAKYAHDQYDWSITPRGLLLMDVDLYKNGEAWYPDYAEEYSTRQ